MTMGAGSPSTAPPPIQAKAGSTKVTIRPSVISCATPRPATIRIRVATIGSMPSAVTREAVPEAAGEAGGQADGDGHGPPLAGVDRDGRRRAGDGHNGADGEVDAPRGDHQRHAERQQDRGRAADQDVDHPTEQPTVRYAEVEEGRRDDAVGGDGDEQHRELWPRLHAPAPDAGEGHAAAPAMAVIRFTGLISSPSSTRSTRRSRITTTRSE
ncbi:hypothetical protein LRS04_16625 [Phenylobacterium sp. J367]|nr:hypothetical protein [Phenylobacterium sp. J367]MCR5879772.1 hypothetical protein [Phenylobacterium sp. J367]